MSPHSILDVVLVSIICLILRPNGLVNSQCSVAPPSCPEPSKLFCLMYAFINYNYYLIFVIYYNWNYMNIAEYWDGSACSKCIYPHLLHL